MIQQAERVTALVLSALIDVMTWAAAIARIQGWAARRESRYVCVCNVHSVVTAVQDTVFGGYWLRLIWPLRTAHLIAWVFPTSNA